MEPKLSVVEVYDTETNDRYHAVRIKCNHQRIEVKCIGYDWDDMPLEMQNAVIDQSIMYIDAQRATACTCDFSNVRASWEGTVTKVSYSQERADYASEGNPIIDQF